MHDRARTREWRQIKNLRTDGGENGVRALSLYVSAVVLGEVTRGNATLAAARIEIAAAQVTREAVDLAAALVGGAGVPKKANEDALHIATAATNGLDYLLTWNCTHIANAVTIPRVNAICRHHGFEPPLIYTPQEFMEG